MRVRNMLVWLVPILLCCAAPMAAQQPPAPPPQEEPAPKPPEGGEQPPPEESTERIEETITVVGIAEALEAAVEVKRKSDAIVDAIVAEDVGKLPDKNLAEAVQR